MNRTILRSLATATVVATLGLTACAHQKERDAERAQLQQRVKKAEFAAMEAQRKADAAQREADQAKAMAEENDSKIDRAFEKSQQK